LQYLSKEDNMAQVPTTNEVKLAKVKTQKVIDKKIESQRKKGKDFIPHGGGVIPESVWKGLKS